MGSTSTYFSIFDFEISFEGCYHRNLSKKKKRKDKSNKQKESIRRNQTNKSD